MVHGKVHGKAHDTKLAEWLSRGSRDTSIGS
jgi:hypothetical protein